MADLIDRDDAILALVTIDTTRYCVPCKEVLKAIRELPSAEPQIIRCKDCAKEHWCKFTQYQGENGFCSLAERRTDE